jgi:hypothetical protein
MLATCVSCPDSLAWSVVCYYLHLVPGPDLLLVVQHLSHARRLDPLQLLLLLPKSAV